MEQEEVSVDDREKKLMVDWVAKRTKITADEEGTRVTVEFVDGEHVRSFFIPAVLIARRIRGEKR